MDNIQPGHALSHMFWPILLNQYNSTASIAPWVIHIKNTDNNQSEMVGMYHGVLHRLLVYVHEVDAYEKDHLFSQDELLALIPAEVTKWMCMKAYGTPEPGVDNHPTLCRPTSLEFWKKAISTCTLGGVQMRNWQTTYGCEAICYEGPKGW
jgi:hypothetical protein